MLAGGNTCKKAEHGREKKENGVKRRLGVLDKTHVRAQNTEEKKWK